MYMCVCVFELRFGFGFGKDEADMIRYDTFNSLIPG